MSKEMHKSGGSNPVGATGAGSGADGTTFSWSSNQSTIKPHVRDTQSGQLYEKSQPAVASPDVRPRPRPPPSSTSPSSTSVSHHPSSTASCLNPREEKDKPAPAADCNSKEVEQTVVTNGGGGDASTTGTQSGSAGAGEMAFTSLRSDAKSADPDTGTGGSASADSGVSEEDTDGKPSIMIESELYIPLEHLTDEYDFRDPTFHLGGGAFGDVYRAKHRRYEDVAVKVAKRHLGFLESIEMYKKEIMKHAKVILSDHFVHIKGFLQEDHINLFGIVMEYMSYGSLWHFRKDRYGAVPPWPRAVEMVYQIICGMDFLHNLPSPVIHRDLKLDNVLVTDGYKVKVADLGLATTPTTSRSANHKCGTPTHQPPEAFDPSMVQKIVTTKYDVYSFALTVWEFLSGEHPYTGHGEAMLMMFKLHFQTPPDNHFRYPPKDTPSILKDIVKRGWSFKPSDRPEFSELKRLCSQLRITYTEEEHHNALSEMAEKLRDNVTKKQRPNADDRMTNKDNLPHCEEKPPQPVHEESMNSGSKNNEDVTEKMANLTMTDPGRKANPAVTDPGLSRHPGDVFPIQPTEDPQTGTNAFSPSGSPILYVIANGPGHGKTQTGINSGSNQIMTGTTGSGSGSSSCPSVTPIGELKDPSFPSSYQHPSSSHLTGQGASQLSTVPMTTNTPAPLADDPGYVQPRKHPAASFNQEKIIEPSATPQAHANPTAQPTYSHASGTTDLEDADDGIVEIDGSGDKSGSSFDITLTVSVGVDDVLQVQPHNFQQIQILLQRCKYRDWWSDNTSASLASTSFSSHDIRMRTVHLPKSTSDSLTLRFEVSSEDCLEKLWTFSEKGTLTMFLEPTLGLNDRDLTEACKPTKPKLSVSSWKDQYEKGRKFFGKKKKPPKSKHSTKRKEQQAKANNGSFKQGAGGDVTVTKGNTTVHMTSIPSKFHIGDKHVYHAPVTYNYGSTSSPEKRSSPPPPTKPQLTTSTNTVSRKDILDIVHEVPYTTIKSLGRKLGLQETAIEDVIYRNRHDGTAETVHQLIREWQQTNGRRATKKALANALWDAKCYEAAKLVC